MRMKSEIGSAVEFIAGLLKSAGCSHSQVATFITSLESLLAEHYQQHWFPERPCKGSAYRCIRINHKMDPLVSRAALSIGLSAPSLFRLLPRELTLWVDPYEVSYRIGEDGSICVLYDGRAATTAGAPSEGTSAPPYKGPTKARGAKGVPGTQARCAAASAKSAGSTRAAGAGGGGGGGSGAGVGAGAGVAASTRQVARGGHPPTKCKEEVAAAASAGSASHQQRPVHLRGAEHFVNVMAVYS
ncbi:protein BTG1-like [Lampetra fluviatilis]